MSTRFAFSILAAVVFSACASAPPKPTTAAGARPRPAEPASASESAPVVKPTAADLPVSTWRYRDLVAGMVELQHDGPDGASNAACLLRKATHAGDIAEMHRAEGARMRQEHAGVSVGDVVTSPDGNEATMTFHAADKQPFLDGMDTGHAVIVRADPDTVVIAIGFWKQADHAQLAEEVARIAWREASRIAHAHIGQASRRPPTTKLRLVPADEAGEPN